jgi:alpha-amylase
MRAAAAFVPLALLACRQGEATSDAAALPDAGHGSDARGAVFVHLFEWRWTDVARECEAYLGPAGFAGVQVSPPSEHAVLAGAPWWQRYQTVGYSIEKSRSGTGDEFRDMVRRCAAAGVGIYVDAVINHMTAQASGVGSNGTAYTKYAYGDLYAAADFHMPACMIAGSDYQDAPERVRSCELLGLADLDTAGEHVRGRIAGYLASLVDLGVRGFRIDAAKHMDPSDLDAIVARVPGKPYYFLEVIDHGGEAIRAADYLATGQGAAAAVDVTEFKYDVADAFRGAGGKTLAGLHALDAAGGDLLPGDRAVVFVNNHDTQRASSLFYQDGPAYDLATVFMLAWPYGHPSILSSYGFDRATPAGRDMGPPTEAPDCAAALPPPTAMQGWLCEHRRPFVARLLAFRRATIGEPVTDWWDDGANQIAFGRGTLGFVAINNGSAVLHRTFTTSLPSGSYRDLFQGASVDVDAAGNADITVPSMSAVVLQKDQR